MVLIFGDLAVIRNEVLTLTEIAYWEGYRLALHFVMSEKFAMFDFSPLLSSLGN